MPIKHAFTSAKSDGADATLVRASNWNADHTVATLELANTISPSALTANQNDWAPTDLATSSVIRISSDRAVKITGISAQSSGRVLILHNIGEYPVTLQAENTSSTAANRFAFDQDWYMHPTDSLWLWYDGTSSRWRTIGEFSVPQLIDTTDMFDEFLGGSNETGEIGASGWNQTASGTAGSAGQAAVTKHPGIYRVQSGTTSGNSTRIHLGQNANSNSVLIASDLSYMGWVVSVPTITSIVVRLGIGQDISAASFGTEGAFFQFDPTANASWMCYTRTSSTDEGPTDSAVDVTAGNWYLLEILRIASSGNWEFYINGTRVATHTTRQPTSALNVGVFVSTATSAARSIDVDWFGMRTIQFAQRYT